MYGASIVGYKVNQKEERRRIVLETIPFTDQKDINCPQLIKKYKHLMMQQEKAVEDIHVVIFEMKGSASPPTLRRRK